MINGIGTPQTGRLNGTKAGSAQPTSPVAKAPSALPEPATGGATIAADMVVAMGPPVDMDRIQAIRTAIAEGRYNVNPQAIAEKMVDQDIPAR